MREVSITIPMEAAALSAAAAMLLTMADTAKAEAGVRNDKANAMASISVEAAEDKVTTGAVDVPNDEAFIMEDNTLSDEQDPVSVFGANPVAAPEVVVTDINGVPWDSRIHGANKGKMKDGTWKKRRGVAPELVEAVMEELKQLMEIPVPDEVVEAVQGDSSTITTYPALVKAIQATYAHGRMPEVQTALSSVGISSLPLLAARTDLIPSVATALQL